MIKGYLPMVGTAEKLFGEGWGFIGICNRISAENKRGSLHRFVDSIIQSDDKEVIRETGGFDR